MESTAQYHCKLTAALLFCCASPPCVAPSCRHLSIGRYHQHSVDCLDSNMTPLEFFAHTYPNTATFKRDVDEWRAFLGRWAGKRLFPPWL